MAAKTLSQLATEMGFLNRANAPANLSPSTSSAETASMTSAKPLPHSHLRRIWERMAAIYGHKWVSLMGATPMDDDRPGELTVFADTWERGLRGIGEEKILAGVASCLSRTDPWPPSLPEFRVMCLGVPSISTVRLELRGDVASYSPFTLMVFRRLDAYVYRRAEQRHAESILQDAYTEATTDLLRGDPLPQLSGVIENKAAPFVPAQRETVERCLAEMRASLANVDPVMVIPS